MNADFVRNAVSRFGDDPEGIGQFRKVVIGLAIAGKLVGEGQLLSPAEMLDQIESEKTRLVRDGPISRPKRYSPVIDEQLPEVFSDPSSFVPLGSVARIEKGLTGIQAAKSGNFPLVVTAAERASCDHFDFEGAATIVPLVSSTGHGNASINRLHYQEGRFALGTILAAVFPYAPKLISARFIFEYLSTFKDELLVSRMTGTANVTLSVGRVAEVPVPLICPSIQRRADELMALCDQLEAARVSREAVRDTFTLATLAKLNTPDPETFAPDARFALSNLAPLTTRPDQIKQLRQTILNLAVRGRLVAQDAADEPASELLSKLAKLRATERRRSDALAPVENQTDLPLPKGWIAARFGEVFSIRTGYAFKSSTYAEKGTLILRVVNFDRQGRFDLSDAKYIDGKHIDDKISKFHLVENDILMVMVGGTIGKTAKVGTHILPALLNQNMWRIRSYGDLMSVDFSYMLVRFLNQNIDNLTNSTHGHFAMGDYEQKVVPIPPLAEQHRIVAKVDELIALCDELEASITKGEQVRSRLLEAVLHNALEPA